MTSIAPTKQSKPALSPRAKLYLALKNSWNAQRSPLAVWSPICKVCCSWRKPLGKSRSHSVAPARPKLRRASCRLFFAQIRQIDAQLGVSKHLELPQLFRFLKLLHDLDVVRPCRLFGSSLV